MKDKIIRNVDETLWRQAKSQAAIEGISVKKLIEDAIREYVAKRKEGK